MYVSFRFLYSILVTMILKMVKRFVKNGIKFSVAGSCTNRYEQKISVEISVLHDKKGTYNHSLYTFISNTCSLYRVPKNSKWRLICYLTLLLVLMIESSRLYQLKQDSFSLNLEIGTHMALLKFFHRFSAICSLFD